MKNMIKTAVVGAVAAAFVASVAVASSQQSTGGEQQQQRVGQGRRGGPGGPGGPGGRGFGGLMFADLTEQQRAQIKAIHEAERQGQQGPPADAKLRQQLEQELLADTPNDQTIETLKQQIAAAELENLSKHIAVQKQISQVLTAEQRAKARERLAKAPEGPGRGRRGGGGFHFGPRH
jgi:Spy/CpxP family protein refolding chaperone